MDVLVVQEAQARCGIGNYPRQRLSAPARERGENDNSDENQYSPVPNPEITMVVDARTRRFSKLNTKTPILRVVYYHGRLMVLVGKRRWRRLPPCHDCSGCLRFPVSAKYRSGCVTPSWVIPRSVWPKIPPPNKTTCSESDSSQEGIYIARDITVLVGLEVLVLLWSR